jgi:hypothetical protein
VNLAAWNDCLGPGSNSIACGNPLLSAQGNLREPRVVTLRRLQIHVHWFAHKRMVDLILYYRPGRD